MYNPQHLHECEKEKKRNPRKHIDQLMTVIGGVASLSSVPQIIKIWETGNITGISLTTYLVSFGTVCTWLLYGVYIKNKPLTVTSSISAVVIGVVIVQLLMY